MILGHPQIEALGAFDEFNAALGVARAALGPTPRAAEIQASLLAGQKKLVALMGEIACAEDDAARYAASSFEKLTESDLAPLDAAIAALESRGLKFEGWATPGATPAAAALDLARTAGRRAERRLVALARHGRTVRPVVLQFVNRFSDLLWLLAREQEQ